MPYEQFIFTIDRCEIFSGLINYLWNSNFCFPSQSGYAWWTAVPLAADGCAVAAAAPHLAPFADDDEPDADAADATFDADAFDAWDEWGAWDGTPPPPERCWLLVSVSDRGNALRFAAAADHCCCCCCCWWW